MLRAICVSARVFVHACVFVLGSLTTPLSHLPFITQTWPAKVLGMWVNLLATGLPVWSYDEC